jgi:hypothetical protein
MDAEDYPQRPERPLGVTLLTIWDGIAVGVIPAMRSGIIIASNSNQDQISIINLCLEIGLPVVVVTAALGTFRGNDRARLGLLILLTLYFGLNAFQNAVLLASGNLTPDDQLRSIGGILSAFISVSVNLWYFLRPQTIAYFRKPINPQD